VNVKYIYIAAVAMAVKNRQEARSI